MCFENTKVQIENAAWVLFSTHFWYYYCIARKVNLGLVICLRTQITQDYLYIAQGGYQSAIYQHTFSTAGLMTTWSWRPPSPMCLGKKPKNHVELRERIHSFNPPPPPPTASACCSWYIVHTGLKSTFFRLIWKAHHGQEKFSIGRTLKSLINDQTRIMNMVEKIPPCSFIY